jgi:steroid Delta-isomerase
VLKQLLAAALTASLLTGPVSTSEGGKPAREAIGKTMEAYIAAFNAGDPAAVTALYDDSATVEDPAGSVPRKGKQAIKRFYETVCGRGSKLEPVSINPATDGSGAMLFQIRAKAATVNVIDVMTFNGASKITSMKAYSAISSAPQ